LSYHWPLTIVYSEGDDVTCEQRWRHADVCCDDVMRKQQPPAGWLELFVVARRQRDNDTKSGQWHTYCLASDQQPMAAHHYSAVR